VEIQTPNGIFLLLWKDADSGLAEFEGAKEALKRLKKD